MIKHPLLCLLFLTSLLTIMINAEDVFFVTSNQACADTCQGDLNDPFNNLFSALEKASESSSATIFLLYDPSAPHYLSMNSPNPISDQMITYQVNNLLIEPLFCAPSLLLLYPRLSDKCLEPGESLTVYVKNSQFTIDVTGSIEISHIVFDGIEDIAYWNNYQQTTELENCLYNPLQCCSGGSDPTLTCSWSGDYSSLGADIGTHSLFTFQETNTPKAMKLEEVTFQNLQNPSVKSLVEMEPGAFNLVFNNTKFDRLYFDKGLISYANPLNTNVAGLNYSNITLENIAFTNYNPSDLQLKNASRQEGYLFHAENTFSGTLKIHNSIFTNISSSLRNTCWPQTKAYYASPMNNLLKTDPKSRSNLWYYYDKSRAETAYQSSLIHFKSMDGTVFLNNSTFTNIIGTSGSVLRVDDITSSNTWFTINSSTFDSNFAYDRFPNIMIAKKTSEFSKMLECPYIEVLNSEFKDTYGCPGAYGNNLFLCYWDSTPPIHTTSLSSSYTNLNWQQPHTPFVTMRNSTFQNNLMSVSNSLAIIGTPYTVLENNTFKENGGTTADIAWESLKDSYFLQRYPDAAQAQTNPTHFGQSTCVYIDRVVQFHSQGNLFQGNWGPWEGSLALATAITVTNWIINPDGISFTEDQFLDHQGPPSGLLNNYMDSLVTFSVDLEGSKQLATTLNLQGPINILFDSVKFSNNILNFDYSSYTYNSAELSTILTGVIPLNIRYQSGLVKLVSTGEALDELALGFPTDTQTINKVGFAFTKTKILNNELLSSGCLFMAVSFLETSEIIGNQIYTAAELLTDGLVGGYLLPVDTSNQGLFCIGTQTSSLSLTRTQLTAHNLLVKDNVGIIFNIYPNSQSPFYLSDSLFVNNTCLSLSMISCRDGGQLYYTNNIFVNNNNLVGSAFFNIESTFTSLFNTYLANNGKIASIIYMESTYNAFEGLTKQHWNDINPSSKVSADGTIPLASMYFISYSYFIVFECLYKQSIAFSGLFVVPGGNLNIYYTQIVEHQITGCSILGTFYALATVNLQNVSFLDNVIIKDPLTPNKPALIVLLSANFYSTNLEVKGGKAQNGGLLMFASGVSGLMSSTKIENFYNEEKGQAALFELSFSTVNIDNLNCSNITGLFKIVGSKITLDTVNIQNIIEIFQSQFLVAMSEVNFQAKGLRYYGDGTYDSILPLIGGERNNVILKDSYFLDASGSDNSLFDLSSSSVIFVYNSIFEYSQELTQVTLFSLTSATSVVIQDSVFTFTGKVVKAIDIEGGFYFLRNTLLTNSHLENIIVQDAVDVFLMDNQFLRQNNSVYDSIPFSQIEIIDSTGLITIQNNILASLYGTNGIVSIIAENSPYNALITNNVFIDNTASNGGAIYLSAANIDNQPHIFIVSTVFLQNKAVKGGALYQTTSDQTQQGTQINKSIFLNNTADQTGGAIYFDYSPPTISQDSLFYENYAMQQLNHIASYPVKIIQLTDDFLPEAYVPGTPSSVNVSSNSPPWQNTASGIATNQTHIFALIDMYNQVVFNENDSILQVLPQGLSTSQIEKFYDSSSLSTLNGLYTLENFIFTYKTNSAINVTFTSTAIPNFQTLPVSTLTINPSITVQVNFRPCGAGEYNANSGSFITCQTCPSGFWQIDAVTSSVSCSSCDLKSTICLGGSNVGPRPGYWRMNTTTDIVMECPFAEACIGNDYQDDRAILDPVGKCAENYQGNLCNTCSDGWAKGSGGSCVNCETNSLSYALLAGMMIIQIGMIAFGVKEMMRIGEEYDSKNQLETRSAILFRILITYTQVFSVLIGSPIDWPDILNKLIGVTGKVSSVSGGKFFTLDCFFEMAKKIFGADIIFLKALFTSALPLFYIILGLLFWVIYFKFRKRPIFGNKDFLNKIITTVVIICFDQQPQVIKSGLSLFNCVNLYRTDSPVEFLNEAYDIQCWQGEHLKWILTLTVPSLCIWMVLLPSLMLFVLRRNVHRLNNENFAKRYSFVYNGYKPTKFYWEVVVMIRKIFFIVNTVFASSLELEVFLSLCLLAISFIFHQIYHPYQADSMNDLERISILSLGVVNVTGLYFTVVKAAGWFDTIIVILGFFGNLYFFLWFGRYFFALQIDKLKQNPKVMKILNFIDKKFCCWVRTPKVQRAITRATTNFKRLQTGIGSLTKIILLPDENLSLSSNLPRNFRKFPSSKRQGFIEQSQSNPQTPSPSQSLLLSPSSNGVSLNFDEVVGQSDSKSSKELSYEINRQGQLLSPSHSRNHWRKMMRSCSRFKDYMVARERRFQEDDDNEGDFACSMDNLAEKLPGEDFSSARSLVENASRKVIEGKGVSLNDAGLESEGGAGRSKITSIEMGISSRPLHRKGSEVGLSIKKSTFAIQQSKVDDGLSE